MTAQRPRKTAQRSCVACRKTADKRALLRIVRNAQGEIACDSTGKLPGRGAYLCGARDCLIRARKGRLLERALRTELREDDWERLERAHREQSTV
jgi:predicted RNA-binding protein YlxR (DUF448 family)